MSEQTSRLGLPYILPSQAQKHVTHNEALQKLDAVTQLVIQGELATPPQALADGDCFLIAANPTDIWAQRAGHLAFWQDLTWSYLTPAEGWRAWFADSSRMKVLYNGQWQDAPLPATASFRQLGIDATPDSANRLIVSSPASLFTAASTGGGHQIKVNKSSPGDTASLLFQSGWSGRAEMGLSGNDSFAIKSSSDGSNWKTALAISDKGHVLTPERPVVRAGRASGNVSHASGSLSGFTDLTLQQGGFVLADIVTGTLKELKVPATGLYLVTLSLSVVSSSGHTVSIRVNGTTSALAINGTTSAANSMQSVSFMAAFNENDRISLAHSGTCQLAYGAGKTEISLVML